ncbi:MAG: glycosyltransferase family 39 protein [Ilumatobacteraceae bacterium]|nr:glycosyltransferase family 39 protein [Ilumatobacteraceae bacterium]
MSDRTFWSGTAGAVGVGVIARAIYIVTAALGRIELFGDAETYHLLGRHLAGGAGYVRPREYADLGISVPTAEFPPLYPSVLAFADLVGLDNADDQRFLGCLVGAASIVVVALLGRAVAGAAVGVIAAGLLAVYPQMIVFDGSLVSEGWYFLFVALTLWCVYEFRSDRQRPLWWLAAAGAAVGLGVLTRSEAIVLLPALLVPAALVRAEDGAIDWRTWGRRVGVASIGVVVCVGGWTIRNAVSLDHIQPFTNNSGTLLAGANCERTYRGEQAGLWRIDCALAVDVAGLDETDAAAQRRSAAIDFAVDNPERLPAVATLRVLRTAGVWDVRTQLFYESLEGRNYQWLWAGWIGWIVLAPAAVVGGALARRRRITIWPLVVPVGMVFALVVFTYGNQRFRVAAEPSVIVLAAVAAAAGLRRMRSSPELEAQVQEPAGSS